MTARRLLRHALDSYADRVTIGAMARLAVFALACFAAACSVGPPPGFSQGDRWAFPLIGPLENGVLLAPVMIGGKGPYVFAIDPDANTSIIDQDLVTEIGLRIGKGPHRLDESDTQQVRFYAEVQGLHVGTLVVEKLSAMVVKPGTYDIDGRQVRGVIGKDVLADSLVFGFDRDAGMGYLVTTSTWKPPEGFSAMRYDLVDSKVPNADVVPLGRKLISATVGAKSFAMHLDLGAVASQLRQSLWDKAQLAPHQTQPFGVVDEAGSSRIVSEAAVGVVTVGNISVHDVPIIPYDDKRWEEEDLDGALGLSFFRPFDVWANWNTRTVYIAARKPPADAAAAAAAIDARISRWESTTLSGCAKPGCVTVNVIDPLAAMPADQRPAQHPGLVVTFKREASATNLDLEVVFSATPAQGKPPLPSLLVNFPAGTDRVMGHLKPDYVGATLALVDVGLFPRKCPIAGGCLDQLAP